METKKINRREFLKTSLFTVAGIAAATLGSYSYISSIEPSWLDVTHVKLALKRVPAGFSGLRMVQVSDIHLGGWMNGDRLEAVVKTVLKLKPDLIALTGDFLFGSQWGLDQFVHIADMVDLLKPLSQSAVTVAVMGNHDYWTNPVEVRKMMAETQIRDLSNDVMALTHNSEVMYLAGVDDIYEDRQRLDVVMRKLGGNGAAVLLAHEPDYAQTSGPTGQFDLQISGHSHGGQVVIPFVGPLILPDYGKLFPSGLYQIGSMLQYTNRGVGVARIPYRFNCRPEITEFTLLSANSL
jgi:predicted MPP superfamily phosphohydrolase